MTQANRITTKTRLKTQPPLADIKDADFQDARAARRKADMEWRMNFAKIKLNELSGEKREASESFQTFHNTARKKLWYIRRRHSA